MKLSAISNLFSAGFKNVRLATVIPIPQSRERNLALLRKGLRNRESGQDSSPRSVESHVIPAKAGIHLADVDPRLRGGDEGPTFISMDGPQAHDHSE